MSSQSISRSSGRYQQHRFSCAPLLVALLALVSCTGSDDPSQATSVSVTATDGTEVVFAVLPVDRVEVGLADQELVTIRETNATDQTLDYSIGVAITGDGCDVAGVARWSDVQTGVDDGTWPTDSTSLPPGSSAGTTINAELPRTCTNLELVIVARSANGSTDQVQLIVPTTAG